MLQIFSQNVLCRFRKKSILPYLHGLLKEFDLQIQNLTSPLKGFYVRAYTIQLSSTFKAPRETRVTRIRK